MQTCRDQFLLLLVIFSILSHLIMISNCRKNRRRSAAERAFELFCKTFFFSDIFIVYCFAQMLSIQLAEIGEDLVLHFYSHILHFALSLFSSSQHSRQRETRLGQGRLYERYADSLSLSGRRQDKAQRSPPAPLPPPFTRPSTKNHGRTHKIEKKSED